MKISLIYFCMFVTIGATAQDKKYYDWQWKPANPEDARFATLTDETDSGWVRRDFYLSTKKSRMKGLYKDKSLKKENGWFRYFYVNQILASQGNYVNGKRDGLWVSYHFNGMMKDSGIYEDGRPITITGWHNNGRLSDSSLYDRDGNAVHSYWFDNGQLSHTGSSYGGDKEGVWKYFHKNGKLAAVEEYKRDELISRKFYDEAGIALTDTVSKDRPASFKGGNKKWRAFLLDNLDFLDGVKLVNTFSVTVVVALTIDEAGNISDAYVDIPVSPAFDAQALKVINRSPAWLPAIDHNRNVKSFYKQAITFGQID